MTQICATHQDFRDAMEAFREGDPVLIHDFDSREGETDIVFPATSVTAKDVCRMRNDAGGLICVAVTDHVAREFDLPFIADEVDHSATRDHDLEYDTRSSFSLTVNHRDTYTGITDVDRVKTIQELGRSAAAPEEVEFGAEFRSPGHVPVLRAAPKLIQQRHGHTEFGLALTKAAGIEPAVVVCEMLSDKTGRAKTKEEAYQYALEHDIPFVDGPCLIDMLGDIASPYPREHPRVVNPDVGNVDPQELHFE